MRLLTYFFLILIYRTYFGREKLDINVKLKIKYRIQNYNKRIVMKWQNKVRFLPVW